MEVSNVSRYYLYSFFINLLFHAPILVIFFQSLGLTLSQVMLLPSIALVARFVLEMPTGVFADRWGRKNSMLVGTSIMSVAYFSIYLSNGFNGLLFGYCLLGIGRSFCSGAESAFVYDSLSQEKRQNLFKKVRGRGYSFFLLGNVAASAVGGIIGAFDLRMLYALTTISMVATILVVATFREPPRKSRLAAKNYQHEIASGLIFSIRKKQVFWLMVFYSTALSLYISRLYLQQPYFIGLGFDIFTIGIISSSTLAVSGIVSFFAHDLETRLGEAKSLALIGLSMALPFFAFVALPVLWVIPMMHIQQIGSGYNEPVIEDYIHKHVASRRRATLMSVMGFYSTLIGIVGMLAAGIISENYGLATVFIVSGAAMLAVYLPTQDITRRRQSR